VNEQIPTLIAALDVLAVQQQAVRRVLDPIKMLAVRPAASAPAKAKVRTAMLPTNKICTMYARMPLTVSRRQSK